MNGTQKKANTNQEKHGIGFNEAKTVFDDTLAYIFNDEWNSFGKRASNSVY